MAETVKQDIDWGGSAFPCEGGSDSNLYPDPGMSLRDWFAGQVIGHIAASDNGGTVMADAQAAYRYADAMIAARKAGVA